MCEEEDHGGTAGAAGAVRSRSETVFGNGRDRRMREGWRKADERCALKTELLSEVNPSVVPVVCGETRQTGARMGERTDLGKKGGEVWEEGDVRRMGVVLSVKKKRSKKCRRTSESSVPSGNGQRRKVIH